MTRHPRPLIWQVEASAVGPHLQELAEEQEHQQHRRRLEDLLLRRAAHPHPNGSVRRVQVAARRPELVAAGVVAVARLRDVRVEERVVRRQLMRQVGTDASDGRVAPRAAVPLVHAAQRLAAVVDRHHEAPQVDRWVGALEMDACGRGAARPRGTRGAPEADQRAGRRKHDATLCAAAAERTNAVCVLNGPTLRAAAAERTDAACVLNGPTLRAC
eukprot:24028-Prymnesium_polylepis.1